MQLDLPPRDRRSVDAYLSRPPRKRTCLNGKLVFSEDASFFNGSLTLDCMIRDISEGGAKIVLSQHQLMPGGLYLIVVKYGVAHWAKVVWLEFPARGLKFITTFKLREPLREELMFLRKLWDELYTRPGAVEW
ncbi:MAG TPA: PilZ domain-containing protein [Rhizomicrobium sp.]